MEMKEYMLGLYEKAMPANLSWQEKLEAAKTAGFDFIEMSIDETDAKLARLDMKKEEREAIKAAVLATGVPIRSICLSGHRKYPLGSMDPKVRAYSLEMMGKAVLLAADLGVRIIQIAGYDVYYDKGSPETEALFKENIAHCAMLAAAEGIVLGFETMETPFMDTVGKAMKYVDAVNSPYLGVYPDSGNLTNAALLYHSDLFADIKSGKGHIVAVHLKETVPGKYREIPFGTGHVDFSAIVDLAWRLGVRRYVAEFWYTGSETWREDLVSAGQFIRQNFKQEIAV